MLGPFVSGILNFGYLFGVYNFVEFFRSGEICGPMLW